MNIHSCHQYMQYSYVNTIGSPNYSKNIFHPTCNRYWYRGSSHNAVLPQRGFPSYTDVLVLVRGGVRTFYLINSSNTVFLSRLKNQCYRRTPCTTVCLSSISLLLAYPPLYIFMLCINIVISRPELSFQIQE